MLSSLSISNFALIKKQEINFEKGFNCLLGASGAGKSIVMQALSFALGGKSDKTFVRTGENLMRVDAVFSALSLPVKDILKAEDIDADDEVILTRTLSADGKSSVKINGFPATLKTLQSLSGFLVDFCGQHDSVSLLSPSNHLPLLDLFSGREVETLLSKVSFDFEALHSIKKQIESLGGDETERQRAKDLLKFQIDEIEGAKLSVGEEEELKERFEFISSAENIFEKVGEATEKLSGGQYNVGILLHEAKSALSSFSNFKDIEDCRQRLENAYYEVEDIASTLENIKENADFDPKELERIDLRLDLIKSLSKKYGKSIEEILAFKDKCQKELDDLENSEFLLEKLSNEQHVAEEKLLSACQKLSDARKKFANVLEKAIAEELSDLEMKGTDFKVDFEVVSPSRKGFDNVKFLFSANVGEKSKDLHKTASGGELSRLLLAFKKVMLGKESVDTVVFDEIDSGISGKIAGKLSEKIVSISKNVQVICITHTPMVASKANNFLFVQKRSENNQTFSTVKTLQKDEAIVEVARLIDEGETVSESAINHAKKLFEQNS